MRGVVYLYQLPFHMRNATCYHRARAPRWLCKVMVDCERLWAVIRRARFLEQFNDLSVTVLFGLMQSCPATPPL